MHGLVVCIVYSIRMDTQEVYIFSSKYTYLLNVQEVCILTDPFRNSVKLTSKFEYGLLMTFDIHAY